MSDGGSEGWIEGWGERPPKIPTSEKFKDRDVVIDRERGMVLIDGAEFPYSIEHDGVSVAVDGARATCQIQCRVFVNNLTIIPKRKDSK